MRPRSSTLAASVRTKAAPPTARLPRCTRCQSLARPSSLEYWHMGDTAMRFFSVTSRILRGSNSIGMQGGWKGSFPARDPDHPGPPSDDGFVDRCMRSVGRLRLKFCQFVNDMVPETRITRQERM